MNPKTTWFLVGCALLVFGLITWVDHRGRERMEQSPTAARHLGSLQPSLVNVVEVMIRTNRIFRAERTNDDWMMVAPFKYPANSTRIEYLLNACAQLNRQSRITASELRDQHQSLSAFGLDPPHANLITFQGATRYELRVGGRTPVGNQVYVQVVGEEGIYFTDDALLERLPRTADDWRDPSFLRLRKLSFNRLELRNGSTGFEVQIDPSTQLWRLTKPMVVRADNQKLGALLLQLRDWQVSRFLPDNAQTDWESLGLQPPETVLIFGQGTNDLLVVQLGKSPTNATNEVYARGPSPMNLVVVPRKPLEILREPFAKFRESRLVSAPLQKVQLVEIRGQENFSLQQIEGQWWIDPVQKIAADNELVQQCLGDLGNLQIREFVKDVVTDFAVYGLANPTRQYTLRQAHTNALTSATNPIVAQIGFGAKQGELLCSRLGDENSVYAVNARLVERLPSQAFQFRDRRIWRFNSTNAQSLTVTIGNDTRKCVRNGSGHWTLAPSTVALEEPVEMMLEEVLYRLGHLQAEAWVARGKDQLARFGFSAAAHHLAVDVLVDGKLQSLALDFGSIADSLNPFAAVQFDGQQVVFEFSLDFFKRYVDFLRFLPSVPGNAP